MHDSSTIWLTQQCSWIMMSMIQSVYHPIHQEQQQQQRNERTTKRKTSTNLQWLCLLAFTCKRTNIKRLDGIGIDVITIKWHFKHTKLHSTHSSQHEHRINKKCTLIGEPVQTWRLSITILNRVESINIVVSFSVYFDLCSFFLLFIFVCSSVSLLALAFMKK